MSTQQIQAGDTYTADLIVDGWTVSGSVLVLSTETNQGTRYALVLAAQGNNPTSSTRWMHARGRITGPDMISFIDGGNGLNAIQLRSKTGHLPADEYAYELGQAAGSINRRYGPVGEGPVGEEGLASLAAKTRAIQDYKDCVEEAVEERDDLIRRLIAGGVPVKDITAKSGLSRERVYQIRDGRR
ncbi:hypothetical protein AB0E62_33980 [Streptomyces sp. NPDC038707]|uniref:hypothetical protein n=1 Tax=Streptomyces sp. NPDC038707 TaxID=3154329 RepID=UPI0034041138